MSQHDDFFNYQIGKLAVAETSDGKVWRKGRIVAFCTSPMYKIQMANGETFWWRADMCDVAESMLKIGNRELPITFADE